MRPISVGANPTSATLTTLYTVPTGYYAKVVLIRATNATASNKHITFDWVDSSAGATYSIVYQQTITSKSVQDWGNTCSAYFVMEEGDTLKVTTESSATFSVTVTIEEVGLTRQ